MFDSQFWIDSFYNNNLCHGLHRFTPIFKNQSVIIGEICGWIFPSQVFAAERTGANGFSANLKQSVKVGEIRGWVFFIRHQVSIPP
jgi:hypothetical protein